MSKKFIFILVVILAILILGWFVFLAFFQKEVKLKPIVLPPIFSVVGEITEITENSFQIKTLKAQNGFDADKDFLVLVASPVRGDASNGASSTVFSKIESPQTISQEDANKPILAQEIKFSDLKIKDNIAVESDIDLRNVSQFTAKSAQILKNIEQ